MFRAYDAYTQAWLYNRWIEILDGVIVLKRCCSRLWIRSKAKEHRNKFGEPAEGAKGWKRLARESTGHSYSVHHSSTLKFFFLNKDEDSDFFFKFLINWKLMNLGDQVPWNLCFWRQTFCLSHATTVTDKQSTFWPLSSNSYIIHSWKIRKFFACVYEEGGLGRKGWFL